MRFAPHIAPPLLVVSNAQRNHVPAPILEFDEVSVSGAVNPVFIAKVARGENRIALITLVGPRQLVADCNGDGVVKRGAALSHQEVVASIVLVEVRTFGPNRAF